MQNAGDDDRETRLLAPDEIADAASVIRAGGLVVFPTETVYGLGADALNASAVEAIFRAKGRPADNPLIVHFPDIASITRLLPTLPSPALSLLRRFSPGPLTVVVPVFADRGRTKRVFPDVVTGGRDTVGVRIPLHPVARSLLRTAATPVAAPSANRSGRPSPTTFAMAVSEMRGRVDAIIDGGVVPVGVESSVVLVDADGTACTILRPGAVTREMIEAEGLEVRQATDVAPSGDELAGVPRRDERPLAPGMKYAHYQPRAEVFMADRRTVEMLVDRLMQSRRSAARPGPEDSIGIICRSTVPAVDGPVDNRAGGRDPFADERGAGAPRVYVVADDAEYAASLFRLFHEFDLAGVTTIVAEIPASDGIGAAVSDRLRRASGGRLYRLS